MPAGPGGSLREARGRQDAKYDVEKMKDNSEPEEDRGVEYSPVTWSPQSSVSCVASWASPMS